MRFTRITLFLLAALLVGVNFGAPAQAANPADWRAGNIIDDSVFNSKDTMDVTSIQAFLDAKVPNCDNWGTQSYGGTTRAAYSQAHGQTLPLICLKEYYENPVTHENNLQGRPRPSGGLSAAQIISAAAQGYSINPQVLIVLLQKEQGLVTDDWPWEYQYRSATGYGCPDTAACDSQYYGFYNQVNNAAWQFRAYANNPNGFNHVAGTYNNVRLSPNAACGTVSVFIQNQATASLYNYTPYTPDQAAINNLYGTGDGCSSYGNRNFWRYFVDWFGSTYANYSWVTVAQFAYFDENKQVPAPLGSLVPYQRYKLVVIIKNTGNLTWEQGGSNPVVLATAGPRDRSSPFCDSTWPNNTNCNRVASLHENSVSPGQYGSFEFWITAPGAQTNFNEIYTPVMAGMSWMDSSSISFPMMVTGGNYSANIIDRKAYTSSDKQTPFDISHFVPGNRYYMTIIVKNTGNTIWHNTGNNPIKLGTANSHDHTSPFCDSGTWVSCGRPATLREDTVFPGQYGSFEFWESSPGSGNYTEAFAPVAEGLTWLDDSTTVFNNKVEPYTWQLNGARAYTDSSKSVGVNINNLNPGERYYITTYITNTGWAAWDKNSATPFSLATASPNDRTSPFCDSGTWISCSRITKIHENTVGGGQNGSFEFWITAPKTPGDYAEMLRPIVDGNTPTWLGGDTINLFMHINQPQYEWSIISQNAFTNSSKTSQVNLNNLQAGQRYYLTMTLRNDSNVTWRQVDSNPMRIGTASPIDRTSSFCDSATWISCSRPAALHEYTVAPGQYGSFEFWITAPATKGSYNEIFAPVIEGTTWLNSHTASYPMTVN